MTRSAGRALLAENSDGGDLTQFLPMLADSQHGDLEAPAAVASTLVAGLELARDGVALIEQTTAFGAILFRAGAADITMAPTPAAQA